MVERPPRPPPSEWTVTEREAGSVTGPLSERLEAASRAAAGAVGWLTGDREVH